MQKVQLLMITALQKNKIVFGLNQKIKLILIKQILAINLNLNPKLPKGYQNKINL